MDRPIIVSFSQEKDNLERLVFELHNYYGSSENPLTFQEEDSLLETIQNSNIDTESIRLFIIDVKNANYNTINFINRINQICENSIKLIISENHNLIEILNQVKNSNTLQFLSRPWTRTDFILALNLATAPNKKLLFSPLRSELKGNHPDYEESINEKLKELIDSNMAKDKFLSIIAHDLKSPFAALLGISEVLMNNWEELTNESKVELVSDIKKTSENTFKLLEDLLKWTKSQKEKLEVCVTEVNVNQIIDTSIQLAESSALQKQIIIKNQINGKLKVLADGNMIATVFRNLITNAVKFIQPGGEIDITAVADEKFCTFCVADNGQGIEKQHILDFFDRENSKKLNGNASLFKGLGLILCKDFIELNGGQIWLETKKNVGSKFFFTLPC